MYVFIGSYTKNTFSSMHEFDVWRDDTTGIYYAEYISGSFHELLGWSRDVGRPAFQTTRPQLPSSVTILVENWLTEYSFKS